VTGKVSKGGQPVSGATVTFLPQGTDGRAATGTTDASGVYNLTTFESGDGALPGSYKVMITKFAGAATPAPAGGSAAEPTAADMDAIYKAMEAQGRNVTGGEITQPGAAPPKGELNEKYANAETSGLTAEVKTDDTNSYDFTVD
jgi:hypothetical protein